MADHLIQRIDPISTLHNLFDFKTPFFILLSSVMSSQSTEECTIVLF